MSAKHPIRTGFRAVAATAIVAGALMNVISHEPISIDHAIERPAGG